MKRIFIVIFILVLTVQVNSQIRRGISPYRFSQDMYLGANIGPNAFLGDGFSEYGLNGCFGLSESVFIGYNLTETFGVRLMGAFGSMNWPGMPAVNVASKQFSTISMSVELLYNLSNVFDIYNLKRPLDISLFAGTGYINREKGSFLNEYLGLVYKAGIQADYRLNYKFDIHASLTGNIVGEQFNEYKVGRNFDAFPELKVGLTYHMRVGSGFR